VPITRYCDEHHLTPRQRLELFIPVCQAVQHAHQKGVIHRDLKPSNVLVALYDGQPVPKVIDFGVAKAAGPTLTEKTLVTGFGNIVGTLEYMSPEQAELDNQDIDTRSDIYSLGVLLYELLAGSPPFSRKELEQGGMLEMLRVIREQEPTKPSTKLSTADGLPTLAANRGTEPAKLTKLVRGELDWIVLKALEKDRSRRYETANGFAMDVQRYLADEPVLACPPSVGYRLRKFARRNKTGLAVAGLVLAFLVLLGTVAGWALRDRAAREQKAALESARKLGLTEEGIRQALDRAGNSLGELRTVLKKKGGVQELLNQPARWELFLRTAQAELTQARRLLAGAEGKLDAKGTQALARLEQRLAGDEADYRLAVRLEKIRLDRATWVRGGFDYSTAATEYSRAFVGFGILTQNPETAAARVAASPIKEQLVAALDDWAWVAEVTKRNDLLEQLLAVARRAAPDPDWGDRLRQVEVWTNREALFRLVAEAPAGLSPRFADLIGSLHKFDTPRAVAWLRRAQAQYPTDFWLAFGLGHALAPTEPAEATVWYRVALAIRPTNATAYSNLGNALKSQKKYSEALAAFQKAIELDPKHALAHNGLGNTLLRQKKFPEASAAYHKAIELDAKRALIYVNLAFALVGQRKLDEAVTACRKAIKLDGRDAPAYATLGQVLRLQKKLEDAVAACHKAIEIDPKCAQGYLELGEALQEQRKFDDAAAFQEAIKFYPKEAESYHNLGNVLFEQGQLEASAAAYHKALELGPEKASTYCCLGNVFAKQQKPNDAIAAYQKALKLNPKFVNAYCSLGAVLLEQGNHEAAAAASQEGIKLDPNNATLHYNLGCSLVELQKLNEAVAAYRKAIDLDPKVAAYHYNLALALSRHRKFDEAIVACKKAIDLDPKCAKAHSELAFVLLSQRKLDEALKVIQSAIKLAPKHAPAYSVLGLILHQQVKLDDAVAAYQKAIKLDPNSAPAYNNLGNALCAQKKLPEAIAAYRKAIELAPKYVAAYHNLGLALAQQGKPDEAVAEFKKVVAFEPKNAEIYRNLGLALSDLKQWPEAIAAYRKAIALRPDYAEAYYRLGVALRQQGTVDEAIAAFHKAVALRPDHAEAYYDLGHALTAQRKLDEAMAAYRQATGVRPGYPEAHCNLGLILRDLGQFAQALEALQRGHELGRQQPGWSNPSGLWVKECERLLALDKKLPDVLAGKAASPAEQRSLADLCLRYKKRYADAALLYGKAFAAEPSLANGLNQHHRYNAALAAVLAAGGMGVGADRLDAAAKARLRSQALDWLLAVVAARGKHLSDDPAAAGEIQKALQHWLDTPDLSGVRDAKELAALPDEERQRWLNLWSEVRDLVRRAGKK
ncbi:MAG TPA: tetratricopeptide repeat protein, partial [Gemmataceae bacterium]|nr:tetratricopeptide repeat protein [Gemmataceae bacterium]